MPGILHRYFPCAAAKFLHGFNRIVEYDRIFVHLTPFGKTCKFRSGKSQNLTLVPAIKHIRVRIGDNGARLTLKIAEMTDADVAEFKTGVLQV